MEQVAGPAQLTSEKSTRKSSSDPRGEYFNYSPRPTPNAGEALPRTRESEFVERNFACNDRALVALRSKPITITTVQNRNGSMSFRVMGTVRPKSKQRKQHFLNWEDAIATQAAWENERMMNGAAMRPKITRLTQAELAQAEAAVELLRGSGLTLIDAARHAFRTPPPSTPVARSIKLALDAFLAERVTFVGPRRHEGLRITGEQFTRFVGEESAIADVTTANVTAWLKSKGEMKKKSWNNYRNDLFTFFAWCAAKPRCWVVDNPVAPVPKHKIVRAQPERLDIETARELMAYLEDNHPQWCLFFALTLFLGIRPDMQHGEIAKLAKAVERDGAEKYFCNGVLHITGEIAKDRRTRQITVPENVARWINKYPAKPSAICPADWPTYQSIRERFKIPHDGLRHTAISAHVSFHGSFADAASRFGNSESMIRTHYFNQMSKAEAADFYTISPSPRYA